MGIGRQLPQSTIAALVNSLFNFWLGICSQSINYNSYPSHPIFQFSVCCWKYKKFQHDHNGSEPFGRRGTSASSWSHYRCAHRCFDPCCPRNHGLHHGLLHADIRELFSLIFSALWVWVRIRVIIDVSRWTIRLFISIDVSFLWSVRVRGTRSLSCQTLCIPWGAEVIGSQSFQIDDFGDDGPYELPVFLHSPIDSGDYVEMGPIHPYNDAEVPVSIEVSRPFGNRNNRIMIEGRK